MQAVGSSSSFPSFLHLADAAGSRYRAPCPSINAKHSPLQLKIQSNQSEHRKPNPSSAPLAGHRSSDGRAPVLPSGAIGVLGVSVESTLRFLEKLPALAIQAGHTDPPAFVTCTDPSVRDELVAAGVGLSQCCPLVMENLRWKRRLLEEFGAGCIVMPCQMLHPWQDEVAYGGGVPVLHVGECVASMLKEASFKPVEVGGNVRIGVLAKNASLTNKCYGHKLQQQGFEVVYPDDGTVERMLLPAAAARRRNDTEGAANLLRVALQVLLLRSVNTVVLAADELVGLLPSDDPLLRKCVDPADAAARAALAWSTGATAAGNSPTKRVK